MTARCGVTELVAAASSVTACIWGSGGTWKWSWSGADLGRDRREHGLLVAGGSGRVGGRVGGGMTPPEFTIKDSAT